jgi:hypothetical protein
LLDLIVILLPYRFESCPDYNKLNNMKNEIKLSDLKQYDSMYWIGDIEPYSDGDGWVFEDEAVRILDEINKKNISNKK